MIRTCIAIVLAAALPASAAEQSFTIAEPFGLAWGPDRVNYPVAFPPGQVTAQGVSLNDAVGKPVPVQLSEIELWPDGKSVRKAVASFMVSLVPDQTATWKLTAGTQPVQQPAGDVKAEQKDNLIELSNARTGIRLVGGKQEFQEPIAGDKLPAPIQGVRLPNGKWIGKGAWQTDIPCTGYFVAIVPVKQGEPAPQFSTMVDGKAIQVKFSDRTDTILLRKAGWRARHRRPKSARLCRVRDRAGRQTHRHQSGPLTAKGVPLAGQRHERLGSRQK